MAASDNDFVVRIGGDSAAGGIVTTGEVFARIASFVGLEIYTTRTIPAEIKGGHVMFQVRVADQPVHSQGDELDLLVAYDQESYDRYYKLLKPGGIFVYNSNDLTPPAGGDVKMYGLPLNDLARKIDFTRGRNIILIGALVKLFDLPYDRAVEVVRKQLGRKKEMLEQNLTRAPDRLSLGGRKHWPRVAVPSARQPDRCCAGRAAGDLRQPGACPSARLPPVAVSTRAIPSRPRRTSWSFWPPSSPRSAGR